MGTTFKYAQRRWSGESDDGDRSLDDEDQPTNSVAAEDIFDDPSILDELNAANASLTDQLRSTSKRSMPARLPPVDAFDFEEACRAKSLAHKFGPPDRDPGPDVNRWRFPAALRTRREYRSADPRLPAQANMPPPRNSRRSFFWGFCTSLAIVIAVPAIFGIVRPLDGSPPASVGSDIAVESGVTGASQSAGGAPPADLEAAATEPKSNKTVVVRNRPAAAAIMAPASTALATPLARPAAFDDDSRTPAGSPEAAAAAAEEAAVLEAPAAEPEPAGSREPEPDAALVSDAPIAEPEPADGTEAAPSPTASSPADSADDDFTRMAQSQLSASADPAQTDTTGVAVEGAFSATERSTEEIDRLLARGEDLLRNGNIASARLLFMHIAAAGDPRGAKAVGMTYDPEVYARLPVTGLVPDAGLAETWYEKAGDQITYTIDLTRSGTSSESGLDAWHAACARKYRSYDPSTGLYVGRSGTKRRCQLP